MDYSICVASEDAPKAFVEKVKARMQQENLSANALARKLRLSHPVVGELVTYGRKPSFDTALALAKWLGENPVSVLRQAGLLPPGPSTEIRMEDWEFLLDQLPEARQDELFRIGKVMVETEKQARDLAAARKRKSAKTSP
jgi:transcriptional regulator with XRE-family HTH domain